MKKKKKKKTLQNTNCGEYSCKADWLSYNCGGGTRRRTCLDYVLFYVVGAICLVFPVRPSLNRP